MKSTLTSKSSTFHFTRRAAAHASFQRYKMARIFTLEDIAELERLATLCSRPTVKGMLDEQVMKAKTAILYAAPKPAAAAPASVAATSAEDVQASVSNAVVKPDVVFTRIEKFAWEAGEYGEKMVTVYVDLPEVGQVKDAVTCTFTAWGFDLQVRDLKGVNYRMLKDNLEKKIVPSESKFIVKKNRVEVKLAKMKGEYNSYDMWLHLESKKTKAQKEEDANKTKKDPTAGIWDMMHDM